MTTFKKEDKKGTLYLNNKFERLVYEVGVRGQLSDGLYEDILSVKELDLTGTDEVDEDILTNHWKPWCSAKVVVKPSRANLSWTTVRAPIHNYKLSEFFEKYGIFEIVLRDVVEKFPSATIEDVISAITKIEYGMTTNEDGRVIVGDNDPLR